MSDAIAPGQPADSAPYKATEAIAFGWRKFKEHPSTLLVPMIVVLVVLAVVALIFNFVAAGGFFGDTTCDSTSFNGTVSVSCGQPFWRQVLGAGLGVGILTLFGEIMLAGIFRGALRVMDGEGFSLGQLFEGYNKMQVVF